jgi:type III secretory pathway component EscU
MNKVLSIIAVIALTAITANAAQDGAALSTKPWLSAKLAPVSNIQSVSTVQRMCAACKTPLTINEQVATKPGHGTIQTVVSVDRCPSCGTKLATELKQTHNVHTCVNACCGA